MCQHDSLLASLLTKPWNDPPRMHDGFAANGGLPGTAWGQSAWYSPAAAMNDLDIGSIIADVAQLQQEATSFYDQLLSTFNDIYKQIKAGIDQMSKTMGSLSGAFNDTGSTAAFSAPTWGTRSEQRVIKGGVYHFSAPLNGNFPVSSLWLDPRSDGKGHKRPHLGLDIAAPRGTPVLTVSGGVVVYAGELDGYGKCVILAHGNPNRPETLYRTVYAHCETLKVSRNQSVKKGQAIATVGNTGQVIPGKNGDGAHLHFEVRKVTSNGGLGKSFNPWDVLEMNGAVGKRS